MIPPAACTRYVDRTIPHLTLSYLTDVSQCADITFSRTVASDTPTGCKNNTGVSATPFLGAAAARNANESTPDGQPQSGASASGTSTGTTAPSSTAGAAALETAAWGVVGAAIVGGLAVL